MVAELLVLRLVHTLAAATLVGAIIFNYFIVRPALRFIPAAPAVVVAQRVGVGFTYLGWISLGLLAVSGVLRLALDGRLWAMLSPAFVGSGSGRLVLLMIGAWAITVIGSAAMTFLLQPVLLHRLTIRSNPDLLAVERRRDAQVRASEWLDRLQVLNLVSALMAVFAGTAVAFGGVF